MRSPSHQREIVLHPAYTALQESVRHGDPFSQTISKLWDCHSTRPFLELHDPDISEKVSASFRPSAHTLARIVEWPVA